MRQQSTRWKIVKTTTRCVKMTRAVDSNTLRFPCSVWFICSLWEAMFHIHLCCFDMHELLLASSHALNQDSPFLYVARQDVYRWCQSSQESRKEERWWERRKNTKMMLKEQRGFELEHKCTKAAHHNSTKKRIRKWWSSLWPGSFEMKNKQLRESKYRNYWIVQKLN